MKCLIWHITVEEFIDLFIYLPDFQDGPTSIFDFLVINQKVEWTTDQSYFFLTFFNIAM